MSAVEIDALVDALEAAGGFPPCTPREFAVRVEEQLRKRAYMIVRDPLGPVQSGDRPCFMVGESCATHDRHRSYCERAQPVDNPVEYR